MLELAVKNSEEEIIQHQVDKQALFVRCQSCGHKWVSTVGEMTDEPTCRKCHK